MRVDLKKRNWDLDDEIIAHTLTVHEHPEKRADDGTVRQCPQCCHTHFIAKCKTIMGSTGEECGCPVPNNAPLKPEYL